MKLTDEDLDKNTGELNLNFSDKEKAELLALTDKKPTGVIDIAAEQLRKWLSDGLVEPSQQNALRLVVWAAKNLKVKGDPPCPYCDDTGDVHRADGEWRGTCSCPVGAVQELITAKELLKTCEAELAKARTTAEYWKAEHLAGNAALGALKAAKSEMRDWHFEHPAIKQIDEAITTIEAARRVPEYWPADGVAA